MTATHSIPGLFAAQAGMVRPRRSSARPPLTVQLRWQVHPTLGLSRSPFRVLARGWSPADLAPLNATAFFPLGPRCRTVRTGMLRETTHAGRPGTT